MNDILLLLIKKIRNQNKITQVQMAQVLGISRLTYSLIETGKREMKILEKEKISAITGIPLTDFDNSRALLHYLEKNNTQPTLIDINNQIKINDL